jgi:hypothetical protein
MLADNSRALSPTKKKFYMTGLEKNQFAKREILFAALAEKSSKISDCFCIKSVRRCHVI